jgi:bifunctional ADP-heptose synthase (sugar kinase/adenylyltransferase)
MAIIKNIRDLREILDNFNNEKPIYMTSGGFDPLHVGHVKCIQETVKKARCAIRHPKQQHGIVVVVVNADSFLIRKKGYAFMPLMERMEIINSIEGVDYVVSWEAEWPDQTVIGAIDILRPQYFTKGGDRINEKTIPEWDICKQVDCEIIAGVGKGGKIQSSSDLIRRAYERIAE